MRTRLYLLAFVFISSACAVQESKPKTNLFSVVPKPVSLRPGDDVIQWSKNKPVAVVADAALGDVANLFVEQLALQGVNATTAADAANAEDKIFLSLSSAADSVGDEGYRLEVSENGVHIAAKAPAGVFYGAQTLIQLITEDLAVPFVAITDYPRFNYRGLHLDVGRHMFPTDFIKKYIDLLSRHKLNRFHWHLTEDQGWRIEIKKYPRLEVSSQRKETVVGRQTTKTRHLATYDGKPYGGFYTQDEVREIVKYAADRHVTVIPEIELPGHATAALAAYPNLGCTGGPYEVATSWGVFTTIYCAGKEDSFVFLQDVLDEVMTLFPSTYIHIGGDEARKAEWEKCPNCKRRMQQEKLKDVHELQSYFVGRIEKYLNSKGRQIIGWDEILEGGLAPNATVMSWRGEEGGIAAASQDHDVIMTPENWVYLDHAQDTSKSEPLSIGNHTPLSEVYAYDPVPLQLTPDQAKRIIGVQANLWTEYIKTPEHAEYMVYPRACALAEVAWTPKESRGYDDFLGRMQMHVNRLEAWKVNYARHINKEFKPSGGQ